MTSMMPQVRQRRLVRFSTVASYWQRDAGWSDRWQDTAVPSRVDACVIGGGLAGLMTAIRLRERDPNTTIAVLEAERVGFGASGRSAGFLSPLAAPVWLLGAERSPDQAWGAARINADVHAIARWLAEHVPAIELRPVTLRLEAAGRIGAGGLAEMARAVELVGLAHDLSTNRGRLSLAMAAYTMHPYKLVRGLAAYAARAGVVIRERARVRVIDRERVRFEDGELRARRIIACTNAYTHSLGIERIRALVVHSFMTATAPLDPALVHDDDFTVEVNAAQAYHRTHAGRIIFGGIDKVFAPAGDDFAVPDAVRAHLARLMATSVPGAEPGEAWAGVFHATATGLPIIGASTRNPALVLNVGYGGTGVALALACAPLAAAVAAGDPPDRMLSLIHDTRISARDALRTVGRIAGRLAQPWR
jgi:glycine/D-amino acid oxidase-like deaminating enzyme